MSNSVSVKAEINFVYKVDGIEHLNDNYKTWVLKTIRSFNYSISELNFTFMSDDDLLHINRDYLDHDYYTDIITFDNTIGRIISADIAISYDRVKDNASALGVDVSVELKRVMIHGVLHCMGFKDETDEQKQTMRDVEDEMLNMFHVEH